MNNTSELYVKAFASIVALWQRGVIKNFSAWNINKVPWIFCTFDNYQVGNKVLGSMAISVIDEQIGVSVTGHTREYHNVFSDHHDFKDAEELSNYFENVLANSIIECRPMSTDKLRGLHT